MPRVHIFDSIKIDIYSRELLPPHFHVLYSEHEVLIEIKTLDIYAGSIPNRQLKIVLNWASDIKVKQV